MLITRTGQGVRVWFHAIRRNGILREDLVAGDFTATVVNHDDTSSLVATVTQSVQLKGLYRFDVPSAYLTGSGDGPGDYALSVQIDTLAGPSSAPNVRSAFSEVLHVSNELFDSLSGSIWNAANGEFNTSGTMGALQNIIANRAVPGDEMALTIVERGLIVSGVWETPVSLFTGSSGSTGDTLYSSSFRHNLTASVDVPLIVSGVWNAANGTFNATASMGNLQNLVASRAAPGDEMALTVGARGLIVSGVWQVPINQFTGSVGGSGSAGDTLYSASFIHELTASVDIPGIVTGVWSAANGIFNVTGTMGHLQNKMAVVSQSLETIRKIETNGWKISGTQQVFFEDDATTPLRIYNLLKSDGSPFVHDATAVVERVLTGSLT